MTAPDLDDAPLGLSEPNVVVSTVVNARRVTAQVPTRLHAADFLRHHVGLTGTHVGCEQGVCGMCTILLDGQAVKSCLMLAAQLAGHEVQTVESSPPGESLEPLQQSFKDAHGLQCGFCTPAFLMTATALADRDGELSRSQLREELAGVMCRCTGYTFILEAVEAHLRSQGKVVTDD